MATSDHTQKHGYYTALGLARSASPNAIRNAYKRLAMKWHPDKCSNVDRTGANLKFQEIQEAYAVLSDVRKKVLYDNGLYDPNDDEEDIQGLSCFMNELSGVMAEVQSTQPKHTEKNNSLEDLQQLFVDIFGADCFMQPFCIPSVPPEICVQFSTDVNEQAGASPLEHVVRGPMSTIHPANNKRNRDPQRVLPTGRLDPFGRHVNIKDTLLDSNANTSATKKKRTNDEQNKLVIFP